MLGLYITADKIGKVSTKQERREEQIACQLV